MGTFEHLMPKGTIEEISKTKNNGYWGPRWVFKIIQDSTFIEANNKLNCGYFKNLN